MKLKSDFRDFYDHWFDLDGPEFSRMTTDGPDKIEQFRILQTMGLHTPPHGSVKNIAGSWWEQEQQWVKWVVVYDSLTSHRGDGKRLAQSSSFRWDGCLTRLGECYRQEQLFCSAYVGYTPGVSWRMLQIGPHRFWIEYNSVDDWRSNCGDGDCKLFAVEMDIGYHPGFNLPIFAVDFVLGKFATYAIDLNVSPGIRGTGVEKHLSSECIVKEIRNHAEANPRQYAQNPFQ